MPVKVQAFCIYFSRPAATYTVLSLSHPICEKYWRITQKEVQQHAGENVFKTTQRVHINRAFLDSHLQQRVINHEHEASHAEKILTPK